MCSFLEAGILVVASLFFCVEIPISISAVVYAVILIFLSSFFMAGVCYGISLILPNEVMYETVMNAIVLPVFFLSTALFPADSITGALGAAIHLNPFTHVINALRSLILYGNIEMTRIVFVLILFIGMGSISFLWAIHRLNKETKI